MSAAEQTVRPSLNPNAPCMQLDGAIWHPDGHEFAVYESVQDASEVTRYRAASRFAAETCNPVWAVRVARRWIEVYTRAEAWEVRWASDDDPGAPLPDGWWPDEEDPSWRFVHRDHPRAHPVYVCVEAGEELPDPVAASGGESA